MPITEPDSRLDLKTLRSQAELKSTIKCLTAWATQMPCAGVFNGKLLNSRKECRSKSGKKQFFKNPKATKLKSPAQSHATSHQWHWGHFNFSHLINTKGLVRTTVHGLTAFLFLKNPLEYMWNVLSPSCNHG